MVLAISEWPIPFHLLLDTLELIDALNAKGLTRMYAPINYQVEGTCLTSDIYLIELQHRCSLHFAQEG